MESVFPKGCYWCKFRMAWLCKYGFPIAEKANDCGFVLIEDLKFFIPPTSLHIGEYCPNFKSNFKRIKEPFVFR